MATQEEFDELKEYMNDLMETCHQKIILNFKEHCMGQTRELEGRLHDERISAVGAVKDIDNLKQWQKNQNGNIADIKADIKDIKIDVKNISTQLIQDLSSVKHEFISGKPSWFVLVIVGIALSIIGAFLGGIIW